MKLEIIKQTYQDRTRYDLMIDNHYVCHTVRDASNECKDEEVISKLINYFEDRYTKDNINNLIKILNSPINDLFVFNPIKICEMTYSDYALKDWQINNKIKRINKDFE